MTECVVRVCVRKKEKIRFHFRLISDNRLGEKKKKKKGSSGSLAGDPQHDPFEQDKRVNPFTTQTR
jgi:hypothetical protein